MRAEQSLVEMKDSGLESWAFGLFVTEETFAAELESWAFGLLVTEETFAVDDAFAISSRVCIILMLESIC